MAHHRFFVKLQRYEHCVTNLGQISVLEGARAGRLGKIASPAYRFHRAPRRWEFDWHFDLEDIGVPGDVYYVRVRQLNDQWAWSSPIWIG